jgi:hypothetical protein
LSELRRRRAAEIASVTRTGRRSIRRIHEVARVRSHEFGVEVAQETIRVRTTGGAEDHADFRIGKEPV